MREFTLEELLDPAWVAPGDPEDHFRPGRGAHLVKLLSAGAYLRWEGRIYYLATDQPARGAGEGGGGVIAEECLEIAREIVQQLADEGDVRCTAGDLEAIAAKVLTSWLTTEQPARGAGEEGEG